jgi:hypothetical protein
MNIYNNKKNLFFKLKQDAPKEWNQYTKHKFVIGLGNGTLNYPHLKTICFKIIFSYRNLLKYYLCLPIEQITQKTEIDRSILLLELNMN